VRLSTTPCGRTGGSRHARSCCGCFAAAKPDGGWTNPARRLLPDRKSSPMPAPCRWAMVRVAADVWVRVRQGGFRPRRCCGGRRRADQADRRRGPEPGRGQFCSGSAAISSAPRPTAAADPPRSGADARIRSRERQAGRQRRCRRSSAFSGFLVTWARPRRRRRANPARVVRRGAAEPGEVRLGAVTGEIGAAHRDPRLRERLSPDAWQVITEMGSGWRCRLTMNDPSSAPAELTLAGAGKLCRSGPGEHEPRRRLAFSSKWAARIEAAPSTPRGFRAAVRPNDEAGRTRISTYCLTLVDCQITYRSRYLVGPALAPVARLAVLDPYNPAARWRFQGGGAQ